MGEARHFGHRVMAIMDRANVPPLVRNYHLFYACIANSDPALRKAMADLGRFPSQAQLDEVIDKFCPEAYDSSTMRRHQKAFLASLDEYMCRLNVDGVELSSFHEVVGRVSATLAKPSSGEALTQEFLSRAANALGEAGNRRAISTMKLLKSLDENRTELEALRNELTELRKIANTDALTGLSNRRAFDDKLAQLVGRQIPFVLLLADLDNFKTVNDKHGHPFGDHVLRSTALTLKNVLEEKTFLARTGGEEFAVILTNFTPENAFAIGEKLRLSIQSNRFAKDREDAAITISIGLARSRPNATANEIYEAADIALYRSKHEGRNRVSAYEPREENAFGNRYLIYSSK